MRELFACGWMDVHGKINFKSDFMNNCAIENNSVALASVRYKSNIKSIPYTLIHITKNNLIRYLFRPLCMSNVFIE